MTLTLESAVRKINRVKRQSRTFAKLIKIARAFVLGAMTTSIWGMVRQGEESEQLYLGFFVFLISIIASSKKQNDITVYPASLALSLEIKHGVNHDHALSTSSPSNPLPHDWQNAVKKEISETVSFERSRLFALATGCLIPLLITAITIPNATPSFQLMFKEVSNVVALLNRGATLKIIQGSSDGSDGLVQKPHQLSPSSPARIELLAQNLVEVTVTGGGFENASPVVELRNWTDEQQGDANGEDKIGETPGPTNDTIFQTFQMSPVRNLGSQAGEPARYTISFAINERVRIFIPAIDKNRHVAEVTVKQLPVPKVTLSLLSAPEDPWPDDQPLSLQINVKAENPLQIVRLLIKSGSRVSNELVANVLNEDMKELSTEYRLIL